MYLAIFMLAAQSLGLKIIAEAAIARHSPYLRKRLSLPGNRLVLFAIWVGYADLDHPTSQFRTPRSCIGDAVTYV